MAAVVLPIAAAALSSAGCGIGGADTGNPASSWRKAPAAPLSPREQAVGIWTGREALVIGGSDAPPCPPGASCGRQDTPPLRDGAAFNPRTRSWRRIADAPVGFDFAEGAAVGRILYGSYWVRVGSRLINPALGDGGEQYRWGRPHGGVIDPARGVWSDLPKPPAAGPFEFGVGVLTSARGHYFSPQGWILDTTRQRWSEIPRLEPGRTHVSGRTIVSAKRKLLVFGGARFDRKTPGGKLLDTAWIWSPPAAGD